MGKRAKRLGCCEKFKEKPGKACKGCPLMATLSKKERRRRLDKHR